jgi:hypothetical protein
MRIYSYASARGLPRNQRDWGDLARGRKSVAHRSKCRSALIRLGCLTRRNPARATSALRPIGDTNIKSQRAELQRSNAKRMTGSSVVSGPDGVAARLDLAKYRVQEAGIRWPNCIRASTRPDLKRRAWRDRARSDELDEQRLWLPGVPGQLSRGVALIP